MAEPTNELILEILQNIQVDIADLKADDMWTAGRNGRADGRAFRPDGPAHEQMERILRRIALTDHPQ